MASPLHTQSKRTSIHWKHTTSPPQKKIESNADYKESDVNIFFNYCEPLMIDFLPQKFTNNSAQYYSTITKFRKTFKSKRPGLPSHNLPLRAKPFYSKNWKNQKKIPEDTEAGAFGGPEHFDEYKQVIEFLISTQLSQ
ncbi:hypothetical protein NPIL_372511 [Nephila pilipes]|uniref:Uncharacterized protein n=1 Tax=Nephila pilipes TaxID=299642 RepID=A0A8X6QCZ6_NEPPI|nr:hypothetical protein NPIL_372511 [Nephila pilipes]